MKKIFNSKLRLSDLQLIRLSDSFYDKLENHFGICKDDFYFDIESKKLRLYTEKPRDLISIYGYLLDIIERNNILGKYSISKKKNFGVYDEGIKEIMRLSLKSGYLSSPPLEIIIQAEQDTTYAPIKSTVKTYMIPFFSNSKKECNLFSTSDFYINN